MQPSFRRSGVRHAVLLAMLFASVLFAMQAGSTQARASGSNAQEGRYSDLVTKASQKGTIRLLVTLNTNFAPEGKLSGTQKQTQRNQIQQAQAAVLSKLQGQNYTLIAQYEIFPIIALNADAATVSLLASLPEVLYLQEDIPVPPTDGASNNVIGVPAAQALGFDGLGWAVAVLDTGVQTTHPYFAGRVVGEACFSTTSGAQSVSVCPNGQSTSGSTPGQAGVGSGANCDLLVSGCEHGTHVAGISVGKNYAGGPGFDGVARNGNLIALQVFSRFNNASDCGTNPVPCVRSFNSDQLAALQYLYTTFYTAQSLKIASANMSLGGGSMQTAFCDTNSLKPAIDNLRSVGIATTISSGNDGFTDGITAPACISSAISVGATDNTDTIAGFSNRASFMSLYAPGVGINSSVPNNYFAVLSGTSMSAPQVAGAWAVMKSKQDASVSAILTAFQTTGVNIPNTGGPVFSNKRIQLDTALGQLNPTPTPTYTPGGPTVTIMPTNTVTPTATVTSTPGTLVVTNLNDSGAGSLRQVMSTAGSGSTITFQNGLTGTITLTSGEIVYTGSLTINGPGARVIAISGNNASRIFSFANAGTSNVVNLSGLTIKNGQSIYGGAGINIQGGTATFDGLAILDNNAGPGAGPAIFNADTALTLKNSTVAGNTSTNRSGIQNQGGASTSLTIINSTFFNNSATGNGRAGAIRNFNALTIIGSTFYNNTASDAAVSNNGGTVTIQNSIFGGTGGPTGQQLSSTNAINSLNYNLIQNAGTVTFSGTTTNNLIGVNPNIQPVLANNGGQTDTLLPNGGSIVLDQIPATGGCNGANTVTDQRGVVRPFNTLCDIGAVEVNAVVATATASPTPSNTPTPTATPITLVYSAATVNGGPTFNNPATGAPPSQLSTNGTAVYYHAQGFTVPVAGTYTLTMTVGAFSNGGAPNDDGYFSLYQTSFNPATPLVNALVVVDDAIAARPAISTALSTGVTYILVTSHYDNGYYGTFTNTIAGPGLAVLVSNATATPTATASVTATLTPAPAQPDTIGVYLNGVFYLRNSNSAGPVDIIGVFGGDASDLPVAGDWNGDGVDSIGVYRGTTGQLFLSDSNVAPSVTYSPTFGNPGDTPFAGHWSADMNHDGIGVYRPSNGILFEKKQLTTGFSDFFAIFGNPGDQGVAGDWDGNGFDSIGVYRGSNTVWFMTNNSQPSGITFSDIAFDWSTGGSPAVVGDWDANGTSTVGYLATGGVFALHSANATAGTDNIFAFGPLNALPIAGKWASGSKPPIMNVFGGSGSYINPDGSGGAE